MVVFANSVLQTALAVHAGYTVVLNTYIER